MIRGDIINFDSREVIFDGHKLLNLSSILPQKFRVIENNVPINYWDRYSTTEGKVIWFDQTTVKDQVIKDVRYDWIEGASTYFEYNDKIYTIKFIPEKTMIAK